MLHSSSVLPAPRFLNNLTPDVPPCPALQPTGVQAGNVPDSEMFRTFNMGVGMVIVVPRSDVGKVGGGRMGRRLQLGSAGGSCGVLGAAGEYREGDIQTGSTGAERCRCGSSTLLPPAPLQCQILDLGIGAFEMGEIVEGQGVELV